MSASKEQGTNIYATAQQIANAHKLFSFATAREYSKFMSCLSKLSLPSSLSLDVMECEEIGTGDVSQLYVTGEFEDLRIFDHINVEDSLDGAWQAFLLRKVWHLLPFFWHGGYSRRYYIFSHEDIPSIELWHDDDRSILNKIYNVDVTPKIAKQEGKYYISCCYWTNWGGLKRELVVITLSQGKATEFLDAEDATLIKFDCGVCY